MVKTETTNLEKYAGWQLERTPFGRLGKRVVGATDVRYAVDAVLISKSGAKFQCLHKRMNHISSERKRGKSAKKQN